MTKQKSLKTKLKNISKADINVSELPEKMYSMVSRTADQPLFCVTLNGKVLKTPGGHLIVHEDERAMGELAAELDYMDELDVTKISLFNLVSTQVDFVENTRQEFSEEMLTNAFLNDPVLKPCAGPEVVEQMKYLQMIVDYLQENGIKYPDLQQIPLSVEWLNDEPVNEDFNNNFRKLVEFTQGTIAQLNDWELTVFITVAHAFGSPTLGLMLAKKRISPNKFAVTYYTSLALNSKVWDDTDRLEERTLVDLCTKQAECMIRYLDQFSPKPTETEKLIQGGETISVEFKSTLRWNIRDNKKDPAIEHEVLKTLAAFLNSDGGTLLVGVDNVKKVLGIELDRFQDEDQYLLYFSTLVNNHIGRQYIGFIAYELETAQGKRMLTVRCQKSPNPIILKNNGVEEFFIRSGPSSIQLKFPKEIMEYMRVRFPI